MIKWVIIWWFKTHSHVICWVLESFWHICLKISPKSVHFRPLLGEHNFLNYTKFLCYYVDMFTLHLWDDPAQIEIVINYRTFEYQWYRVQIKKIYCNFLQKLVTYSKGGKF